MSSVKLTLGFASVAALSAFLAQSNYDSFGGEVTNAAPAQPAYNPPAAAPQNYAAPAQPAYNPAPDAGPQQAYNPAVNYPPQGATATHTAPTGGYAPQQGQPAPGAYNQAPQTQPGAGYPATPQALTQADVTKAAQAYSKARGGAKAALAVLNSFGVKAVTELRPDQYPAAMQAFAV